MEYSVQILVVKECLVDADDDLQAERLAYQSLKETDRGAAIAICVLDRVEDAGGGALDSDDTMLCWRFAKQHFNSIDMSWVEQE